jgi:pyruvate dehydrogenase E2 component (dihydrolipoamide acetyltransferase)
MPIPVIMPKLEMSQEAALIVDWLKQAGDPVEKGEPLLTVETDKVTVEIESPGSGILGRISAKPGDTVAVKQIIAYLFLQGENPDLPPVPEQTAGLAQRLSSSAPSASPAAAQLPAFDRQDLPPVHASESAGIDKKSDVSAAVAQKPRAAPAARRAAREKNIELADVTGSGPGGRIQTIDVLEAAEQVSSRSTPSPSSPLLPEIIPLRGIRRTIAERMQSSYQTIPHIHFTVRVDTSELEQLRSRVNTHAEDSGNLRVSLTAVLIKIVALTLLNHRWLNSTLRGDEIWLYPDIHIGMAVALSEGLIVPIIRNADKKGLQTIAREVSELTQKARQNQLQPADVVNGTFTVSNLGPFGIEQFDALIIPGQAAILAVSAIQQEVVPVDGRIEIRPILRMTLSADHRIVDGAVAARFLIDLKAALEFPGLVLW